MCVLTVLFPEGTNELLTFAGSVVPVQRISGIGCYKALPSSIAAGCPFRFYSKIPSLSSLHLSKLF